MPSVSVNPVVVYVKTMLLAGAPVNVTLKVAVVVLSCLLVD